MEVVTILRHPTLALRLNSIIEEDVQGYLAVAERSFVWIVYAVASCRKETEITTFLRGLSKFSVWNSCKVKSSGDSSACVPVPEGEEIMACGKVSRRVSSFTSFLCPFLSAFQCQLVRYCSRGPSIMLISSLLLSTNPAADRRVSCGSVRSRSSTSRLETTQEGMFPNHLERWRGCLTWISGLD